MTAELRDLRLVGVHLHEIATALMDGDGKLGGRVDGGRRARDDHAVGPLRLLEATLEHVRGDGLAERHRVALEDAAAVRAARRKLGEVDRVATETGDTLDAAYERRVAVDLEQAAAACEPVQVVDVLGDGGLQHAHVLELYEGQMAGVRARLGQCLPELSHRPRRAQPLLPRRARIAQEPLVAVHRRLAVPGPEAAGPPERRDAALDGQPPAPPRAGVAGATETLGSPPETVGAARRPAAAPL